MTSEISSSDQLQKRNSKRQYRVETLADGAVVRLRSPSRPEIRKWRRASLKPDGSLDQAKFAFNDDVLLAMAMVDADDNYVFTIEQAQSGCFDLWDEAECRQLLAIVSDWIFTPRKGPEAALKNSEETQVNGSSGS